MCGFVEKVSSVSLRVIVVVEVLGCAERAGGGFGGGVFGQVFCLRKISQAPIFQG
jgi:hypothetical protein